MPQDALQPARRPVRPATRTAGRLAALGLAAAAALAGPSPDGPTTGPSPSSPTGLPVEEFRLANGMQFLLVRRPGTPTVAAGWMARAGSADEAPGATGLSHLLEHLMFKGTRVVGARRPDEERRLLKEQDRVHDRLLALENASPKARRELEARLAAVGREARATARPGELTLFYSERGAAGLNANTLRDLTLYYVLLPNESLETWFWLESDRLLEAVLRDFHAEKAVIGEERRMRVESTPTGRLDEEVRQLFWGDHPYGRPTMGRPGDLERLRRADAESFLATHYAPHRLTAALVGEFEPQRVRELAELYFGRLRALPGEGPESHRSAAGGRAGTEPGATAERGAGARGTGPAETRAASPDSSWHSAGRFEAECDCASQAEVLYRTVRLGHPDAEALDVLAALLGGRSGRLYRELVLGREIAFTATADQSSLRRAGYFSFRAESKEGASPAALVAAWEEQLERLRRVPVAEPELRRARGRTSAHALRRLKDPLALLQQLLIYEGLGGWRHLGEWPARVLAVTVGDVQRVAATYLARDAGFVALYHRKQREHSAADR